MHVGFFILNLTYHFSKGLSGGGTIFSGRLWDSNPQSENTSRDNGRQNAKVERIDITKGWDNSRVTFVAHETGTWHLALTVNLTSLFSPWRKPQWGTVQTVLVGGMPVFLLELIQMGTPTLHVDSTIPLAESWADKEGAPEQWWGCTPPQPLLTGVQGGCLPPPPLLTGVQCGSPPPPLDWSVMWPDVLSSYSLDFSAMIKPFPPGCFWSQCFLTEMKWI